MAAKIYPKVKLVVPGKELTLLVTFANGVRKLYDCKPLLAKETFAPLKEEWFFRLARVDKGGYGVSWDDDVDLSESELWENGKLVER